MRKTFNVTADCKPNLHYMVDLKPKLEQIKKMVDQRQYFTINRARQYGKSTTLKALGRFLAKEYLVVSLDFQLLSYADFENEIVFVEAFAREVMTGIFQRDDVPRDVWNQLKTFADGETKKNKLANLFQFLSAWCGESPKPIVLMIDEVDSTSNNQVFLDFLSQLRGYYMKRDVVPTFWSVILAGVYDIKNMQQKIRPDDAHKTNSPWNIAADFLVDMSFSVKDISGMLTEYENDYQTGMDVAAMAQLIYDYTSGYPFLVSRICKLVDERIAGSEAFADRNAAWSKSGVLEAVRILLTEKNTLFESLTAKVEAYPKLKNMLSLILMQGQSVTYNPDDEAIDVALMFGFIKEDNGTVVVANRIFETRLYNLFLTSQEAQGNDLYRAASLDKNQFVHDGHLDMKLVLEKFVMHFDSLYGDQGLEFLEADGRRYFLLYLRPIINGNGNYYVEAQTRNLERTDVIVDYHGDQFVVEMKIWRGDAYHTRGQAQLLGYLDHYQLQKGYMLSFNFNKTKEIGVKEIQLGDKILVEAVV